MTVTPADHPQPGDHRRHRAPASSRHEFAATMLFDVVLPVALFYVLRGFGQSQLVALLCSGAAPALRTVYLIVKRRRIDGIGVFVLSLVLMAVIGSFITGSPRLLLARSGLFTGAAAFWILATLFLSRPFTYQALRALMPGRTAVLEQLWSTDASFRRVWRGLTVLWGCGFLVDAVLRVVWAYTLPVDTVPALDGALYAVTYLVLQIISQVVLHKTGTMRLVFGRSAEAGQPEAPAAPAAPGAAGAAGAAGARSVQPAQYRTGGGA